MKPDSCPCCLGDRISLIENADHVCAVCGHRWRQALPLTHYETQQGRNELPAGDIERKIADRMTSIGPLLTSGIRILEIGCAEGLLGERVKREAAVHYTGLEVSADAQAAGRRLDHVAHIVDSQQFAASFDLILAFHVLEHLADAESELVKWKHLLKPTGRLLLETPNGAGHPLLEHDGNPEHAHQFTPASLSLLVRRTGFDTITLTSSHFESPVYTDSLRLLAAPKLQTSVRREKLLMRFAAKLGERFVVYGAGGDFMTYVAPLLPWLNIAALCDTDTARRGQLLASLEITAYDPASLRGLPVLISTTRHRCEITDLLIQQGISIEKIVGLEDIFGLAE
jgi:SAM-dependent methyltransferase